MLVVTSYNKWVPVVPSDTQDVEHAGGSWPDALYIGGAGVVNLVAEDGATGLFTCIAGQVLDVKFRRVNLASTGATDMLALYQI